MSPKPCILWFRSDLRLADNPAVSAAVRHGGPIVPVFIWASEEEGAWPPGAASRWWLHQSLASLAAQLKGLGSRLLLRASPSATTLHGLVKETGADAIFWNRRYEPAALVRDSKLEEAFRASGLHVETFNAALLHEPWTIQNRNGKPFQVFSAFWRACLASVEPGPPLPPPRLFPGCKQRIASLHLDELALEPGLAWTAGIRAAWNPGSEGAAAELERFLDVCADYATGRDRPDRAHTSRLSPHLHFGEIGPRQVWHAVKSRCGRASHRKSTASRDAFLAELGWREFAHHLLFHFPQTPEEPLRAQFTRFPWRSNAAFLRAWQQGRTGYPLVDAGMRELWATGWMHNRVRMVVASFLVKNLLIPWQEGARWFWDTLVDADLANNTLGWQWVAGCGADAAPYFRIFNPVMQGEKFDVDGNYVRRWVPEVRRLSSRYIHAPWTAPPSVLAAAEVQPGKTYPEPLISWFASRQTALAAYARLKAAKPAASH